MKTSEKYEIPWWDEWYEADLLKRQEMVKNLPVLKEIQGIAKELDKKHFESSFTTIINSLFEDLADYMHAKIREEIKQE